MLDEMHVNDEQLDESDIRQLENADEIAHFFARLRYDVDKRTNIPDYAVLGMGSADMRQHIHRIELIGTDPEDGDISIYLFEVRSVTAKLRNDIARRFRERPENAILVLTKDYEELEFVLLERVISRSQSRRAVLRQAIRPIPLTVNRLHPDPIALRVLKRFTCTEEDAAYQWEKLRSAYMLAEWSEEYFNNRALFSDYYLKERLTDLKITPEWGEDVRPVGREIYKHIVTVRKNYTRQTKNVICKGLYEPVFKLLGFDFKRKKTRSSSAEEADYLLYTPGDTSKPIAAALTYVWNRNLDDIDPMRDAEEIGSTPFDIPGAMVVSLLEAQVAPWVIVTNGKLWRLYSSTASNKATNYYEIDLEEAIAANDQITALKYWWLMFRQQAFTGFLDNLLKNSADYAKKLGEQLKGRVFTEIFPQFAQGFIADMRAKGVSNLDEETLATVFSGTMAFLYRLMFILYAESFELLPLNEVRGYREHSLYRMKHEIADAGGTVGDEAPDKLSRQYKSSSTELYDRLKVLFTVIDQGSDELNMPNYNGGLFSQETDSGKFLATYAIPDSYLARGLDWLTRDVDDRSQALVFIDFKSLGVRHLGSIYEGLLEFKLRVAAEKLAVTKEKGKEVYKPAKEVNKPLATIDKGEVYLENDKRERKATGSYYTPDYIVKYIVRHTVGPVLDRKFVALEKRLRDAQNSYRKYAKLVEARRKSTGRDESAAVHWNNPEMQNLVDDCLNVRVLDPAMGSGHFLVEVIDYVSNRLIDFLNAWSENPVWAFLEQTRDDILNDMERQKVTIDADRLTHNDRRFSSVNYGKWFSDEIDPEKEFPLLSYLTAEQLEISIKVLRISCGLGKITDIQRGITPFTISDHILDNTFDLALDGELLRYHYEFSGGKYVKYDPSIAEYKPDRYFKGNRLIIRELISRQFRLQAAYVEENFITNKSHQSVLISDENYSLKFVIAILNSKLLSYFHIRSSAIALRDDFPKIVLAETRRLPIPLINFTTPAAERERLTRKAIGAYDIGDNTGMLRRVRQHIDSDKTDVVHDLLAHLAQRMIDLNKQKQTDVKRFLTWVEKRLRIQPKNDGATGIDSLTGKTILQGYLGDYQKGEDERPWREFHYRLYQNRNRYAVSLSDIEGEIQREYEKSLETLLPIKHELARTDALIDKIVYRLYGLTDEEIELIERPQYEQALADAKAQIVADEKIKDDEEKLEKIAEGILPAAKRFFERVEPKSIEETLDSELPNWRNLPPDAPTFLLTGDYNLHSLPDHMDFSASVIPYTKAVETVLYERIFIPFRDNSGFADVDCINKFLKDFMRGEKKLTLGSFVIILSSSKETALRQFVSRQIPDAAHRVFGDNGLVTILNDEAMLDIRNKAAHDEVISHDEAQKARVWAIQILELV